MDLYRAPTAQKWQRLRTAAGFKSDRAFERAGGFSAGTLWTWVTPGPQQRDPNVKSLRIVKELLGVSLDELDGIFTSWRRELAELAKREARR